MPIPIKGTISGSSAATVLGQNQYESIFTIWQKIMEDLNPGFNKSKGYELPAIFEGNASTRFGSAFEDSNLFITEGKLNADINDREKVFEDNENIFKMSCHVDGVTDSNTLISFRLPNGEYITLDSKEVLFEGKTTSSMSFRNKWGDPGTDKIPANYQIQIQHNMMLTGLKECIVAVLVFPETPESWEKMGWTIIEDDFNNFKIVKYNGSDEICKIDPITWANVLSQMGYHHLYYIKRNDELIDIMKRHYQEWWENYVITKKPPKPMNLEDF